MRADGILVSLIAVSDPVKATTPEALETLRRAGLTVIMATGDVVTTAKSVARKLGITEVYGEVEPQDKLLLVELLCLMQLRTATVTTRYCTDEQPVAVF